MKTDDMRKVQQQVAVITGLLDGLDIESALAMMENASRQAKVADPVLWAKAKAAHERMVKMMTAALVFQRTVGTLRSKAPEIPKIVLS